MDNVSNPRYCRSCGTRLTRGNKATACGPCEAGARDLDTGAPAVPPEFWLTDEMRDALTSRHMGRVMAAFRRHPYHLRPIPQEIVGRWVHITQAQLSRLENGPPIKDLDKLILWARTLRVPPRLLWFMLPDERATNDPRHETATAPAVVALSGDQRPAPVARIDGSLPAGLDTDPIAATNAVRPSVMLPGGAVVPEVATESGRALATSLIATLEAYAATDNLVGPRPLLAVVPRQIAFIEHRLVNSGGRSHARLLYAGARFAEFAGWLHQDIGDPRSALQWSNVALEFAREAGDTDLMSYIWMRKSNIGSDTRRPHLALAFVQAALEGSSALAPRLRAVAFRQQAHAHALAGDGDACARALDHAYEDADADDEAEIARYCTPSYVEMEAAHCWIELGRPQRAIDTLQQGLADWHPGFRRDLGLCLARLAVAHAGSDEPDNAVAVAEHAIAIAVDTRSHRTSYQLARIPALLDGAGARDAAEQARHMLTALR
jgi:tetratricopeptide (TPR) repeat protein